MKQLAMLAALVLTGSRPALQETDAALADRLASGPVVALDTGLVEGVQLDEEDLRAFRGIPYAAPPVGDRRWRAPEPMPAWEGVRSAKEFGPPCPQSPLIA